MQDKALPMWQKYTEVWSMNDAQQMHTALSECVSADCLYTDPLTQTQGREALIACMLDFQRQFPGAGFDTLWFNAHNGQGAARWRWRDGAGETLGEGVSHVRYAEDGRLLTMCGFFEAPA